MATDRLDRIERTLERIESKQDEFLEDLSAAERPRLRNTLARLGTTSHL